MVTRRINFGFLVCFLTAAFVGQTFSQTRRTDRTRQRLTRSQTKNIAQKQKQQELEQRRLRQKIERQLKKQTAPAGNQDELMIQALGATQEQWKAIKPKLNKVRELTSRANVSISIRLMGVGRSSMGGGGSSVAGKKGSGRMSGSRSGYGYGSSSSRGTAVPPKDTNSKMTGSRINYSWGWVRPSQHKGLENLNEGEKICEELFELLEDDNSELEKIKQKMEALRKFRQKAKKELAITQKELRELVTQRQEATLIMMGLLD
jgi:hypothetical protein